jgi:hypothetical protein
MLLEELTFHTYPKTKHLLQLIGMTFVENLGYRQINAFWRFTGLVYWAIGYEESRAMVRTASWQGADEGKNASQPGGQDNELPGSQDSSA